MGAIGGYSASQSEKELQLAVMQNDNERVQQLLAEGANPNSRSSSSGMYVLSVAAYAGKTDIVETLLKAGANPNAQNKNDLRALFLSQKADVIDLLLNYGADMYYVDREYTAFTYWAAHTRFTTEKVKKQMKEIILSQGLGQQAVDVAEKSWMTIKDLSDVIQVYKKHGFNLDTQYGEGKFNGLLSAAENENYEVMELLLKEGVNPNLQTKDNCTALRFISNLNQLERTDSEFTKIATFLIQKGAKINLADNSGYTPLICATQEGYTGRVRTLLNLGADPNLVENKGMPALFFSPNIAITKNLVEKGANPKFLCGGTPATFVTRDADSLEYLIDLGIDVNYVNDSGYNALIYSLLRLHKEALVFGGDQEGLVIPKVNMLIKKGIDVNYDSKLGTALYIINSNNEFDRIEAILRKAGAKK